MGFPLPVLSCSSPTSAKNVKVAAEMLYLVSIEANIHWFMSRILWIIAISGFFAAILNYWKVMN